MRHDCCPLLRDGVKMRVSLLSILKQPQQQQLTTTIKVTLFSFSGSLHFFSVWIPRVLCVCRENISSQITSNIHQHDQKKKNRQEFFWDQLVLFAYFLLTLQRRDTQCVLYVIRPFPSPLYYTFHLLLDHKWANVKYDDARWQHAIHVTKFHKGNDRPIADIKNGVLLQFFFLKNKERNVEKWNLTKIKPPSLIITDEREKKEETFSRENITNNQREIVHLSSCDCSNVL